MLDNIERGLHLLKWRSLQLMDGLVPHEAQAMQDLCIARGKKPLLRQALNAPTQILHLPESRTALRLHLHLTGGHPLVLAEPLHKRAEACGTEQRHVRVVGADNILVEIFKRLG
jgi:hypothetical protein